MANYPFQVPNNINIIPDSSGTNNLGSPDLHFNTIYVNTIIPAVGGGASGYSGYSGTSGYSGYCGLSGYSGYSGVGVSGYSGYCGLSGYSGYCGLSGYSGYSSTGLSGYSGYCGLSGYSGYSGTNGTLGTSGYSGYSGPSGYSGYCGLSGYSGYSSTGLSGYSGYCGLSGYSGYSGNGLSGYSGYCGLSGYSGYSGTNGAGASGYSGYSGTPLSTTGVATSPAATQTDTITHGLGKTPVIIRLVGIGTFTSNNSATPTTCCFGVWSSSGNRCIYQSYNTAAITTTNASAVSSTFSILLNTGIANTFISGIVQTVGATTFEIAWTETGVCTAQNYMWECQ